MRRIVLALVASAAGLAATMPAARAEPSFDCAKAQSVSEKEVCRVPELQWFDRQLARLYAQVKGKDPHVVDDQRKFLVQRDARGTTLESLEKLYGDRLKALSPLADMGDAVGEFRPTKFGGEMWIVRFGTTAGVNLLSVGGGGSTCVFETDNASQNGKGFLSWNGTGFEGDAQVCHMVIAPNGEDMDVQTRNSCQSFCGMRAIMDGFYRRVH